MSEETKQARWHQVERPDREGGTYAMNTATGVVVDTQVLVSDGAYQSSTTFIPGEHWDPEAGEFVAIGRKLGSLAESWERMGVGVDNSSHRNEALLTCAMELRRAMQ